MRTPITFVLTLVAILLVACTENGLPPLESAANTVNACQGDTFTKGGKTILDKNKKVMCYKGPTLDVGLVFDLYRAEKLEYLVFNSPGGYSNITSVLINHLNERRITLVIGKDSLCYSACAVIAAKTNLKIIEEGADIAVHHPYKLGTAAQFGLPFLDPNQLMCEVRSSWSKEYFSNFKPILWEDYKEYGYSIDLFDITELDDDNENFWFWTPYELEDGTIFPVKTLYHIKYEDLEKYGIK